MKNLLIFIAIFTIISCKENEVSKANTIQKIDSKMIKESNSDGLSSNFCLEIDTLPKSNYYQIDLDTFLTRHHLTKNNNQEVNNFFHKSTKDFIAKKESYFIHYPYNGEAYSIKKIKINNNITAVFYAYLFDSEIIQPRIEIQTFNKKQENIDNLIVASTFTSECSGYREFCINDNIIKILDFYYCDEDSQKYKEIYKFKINDIGVFIKQEL